MIAPVTRLKKKEVNWLGTHRCKAHGHTYLEHYNCYLKENPENKRIGFFDIEASNLKADFGIVFLYCIKLAGSDKILERSITPKELHKCLDKEVIKQCIKDLCSLDLCVTYYGTKFDLPFVRSRSLYHKIDFPQFGELKHTDVYYIIKNKFCLSRSRLETACRTLLGKTDKTHIESVYWLKALQGDKESLDYILDHCRKDVIDLEKLYNKVIGFKKRTDKSI